MEFWAGGCVEWWSQWSFCHTLYIKIIFLNLLPKDSAKDSLNIGHQLHLERWIWETTDIVIRLCCEWQILVESVNICSKWSNETFGAPVGFHQHICPPYWLQLRTFNRWRTSGSWIIKPYGPKVKHTPTQNVTSSHAAGWGMAIRMNLSVRLKTWVQERARQPSNVNEQSISITIMGFK